LNDYIAPSQACIIPLSSDGNKLLNDVNDAGEGDGGEILLRSKRAENNKKRFEPAKEDFSKDGKSIKVSLSDCLACSGCVTSAETVLMEQQSVEEFLGQNFSLEGNQPLGGTHDGGGRGGRRRLVVTLSPQSTASLAVKYSVKYEEMLEKMCGFFKTHFNARAVCSSTEARAASRARYAKEFTERKSKSSGLLPMIASACPGWVCYAEKTENALRDVNLLAKAKSPQAIAGTFAKKGRRAAFSEDTEEEEEEEEAYHVSVMPCFDKKLEASRREFKTKREGDVLGQGKDDDVDGVNETDCVLTTTEVVELLEKKCNIVDEAGVRSLPSAKIDSMFASWFRTEDMMDVEEDEQEDALLPPAFAATSGAYLEYVFRKAARDLYGVDLRGKDLEYKTLTNADMREVELKIEGEVKLKFLLAYGFRNVQNVTRALKREPNKWDFVEMMACPSGCANGGGQVPPKQSYLNAKLLKRVEEAYMEGEIESERRNLHSAAVKSLITSAEENGDTLSAYDTTYNALVASNDMKKKVTIANVDNW
jgi:iron only hydrogenase large subunit-like protein